MKIKLDENIPARLIAILGKLRHEVDTVKSEGPAGRDDVRSGKKLREPAVFSLRRTWTFQTFEDMPLGVTTVFFWYDCVTRAATPFCGEFKRYLIPKR